MRNIIHLASVLLLAGCLESNPQPSPGGTDFGKHTMADAAEPGGIDGDEGNAELSTADAGADAGPAGEDVPPPPAWDSPLRVAGEWEPALGVMVGYPWLLPPELMVEIAKDDLLYIAVGKQVEQEAKIVEDLQDYGVNMDNVRLVTARYEHCDYWGGTAYTRDWGPPLRFDAEGIPGVVDYDFQGYPIWGPTCDEDQTFLYEGSDCEEGMPGILADFMGIDTIPFPTAFTGGNALVDGAGGAFSTCALVDEVVDLGVSEAEFYQMAEEVMGIDRYAVVGNYEDSGIQHIDCAVKVLDEERLLVVQLPEDHTGYDAVEQIATDLASVETVYGTPFAVYRIPTGYYAPAATAAYTNSLIINKKILVPLFEIPEDEAALQTFRDLMPGYEIIGFPNDVYPWHDFDALHCRTRAVWDPEMLHMRHRRPAAELPVADYSVAVEIRDYSRAGLAADELELHWRVDGGGWQVMPLTQADPATWTAIIPAAAAGAVVEYWLEAADHTGRHETLPRTAPEGLYGYTVTE